MCGRSVSPQDVASSRRTSKSKPGCPYSLVEYGVALGQHLLQARAQDAWVEQVAHAHAGPPGAVRVRGPDAPARGADLRAGEACLRRSIEGDVVGHDDVRRTADADAGGVDAALRQHGHLADERARVDHDAVADDGRDVRVQDAAGHEVQLEDLVADDDGVAGVVATLVAHDHVDRLREQVHGLALALVSPLQADDDAGWHQAVLRMA